MEESQHCKKCDRLVQSGGEFCAQCLAKNTRAGYRTETILVFCAIALAILFIITGFAAQKYHAKERALGKEWFEMGEGDLVAGQPESAIADYRTALVYDPANDAYELSLAKGLLAAHHEDEASAHLTRLWEHQPENGEVNLELGRLAIRNQDIGQALRYFHNSIYGDWGQQDAAEQRRKARLELYRFLVNRGDNSQAQAELMALAAELPPQAPLHVQVGRMFFDAHEYNQAQKQFSQALQLDKNNKEALAGEGEIDFESGDYHNAEIHLERALRREPHNTRLEKMLELAKLVLSIDPYEPDLPNAEKMRRIVRMFRQAMDRLENCAETKGVSIRASQPSTALQNLYLRAMKMDPLVQERILSRDVDKVTAVLSLVREVEDCTTAPCGVPGGLDKAIALALGERGGNPK